jgi:quercetin dioxygenase-like cupin family protein
MDHNITAAMQPIVSQAEDLSWNSFGGERVAIRISSQETGGAYSVAEGIPGPISGPPLQIHQHEEEIIEVLEGRLMFALHGERFEAVAGDVIVVPRDTPHSWRYLADAPVRARTIFTPGGAKRMFEHFDGWEREELAAIAKAHDTIFVGPPLAP